MEATGDGGHPEATVAGKSVLEDDGLEEEAVVGVIGEENADEEAGQAEELCQVEHGVHVALQWYRENESVWQQLHGSFLAAQGQDLWEVVNRNEVTQPEAEDANGMLRKWKIKAGKAMFILKTTIEEDVLEHIRETKTPKKVWDTFAKLFSKKNDTKLKLIESELLSVAQRDLTVAQYFHKPEFRSFAAAVQGWPTQSSLVEFKNLLAGQEALAKQMRGVSLKNDEEVLCANKGRKNSKAGGLKRSDDKTRGSQSERSTCTVGGSKNHSNAKKFEGKCYNCGKKGHMARDC
ncbi:UNVERIFIED_CONTAM: hypothetical protein Slati_3848700 [Sesamum latifolium]|uniref:CCHC-type domain-containing protein n=1 Tax=Sesamum latifolium TaxID=2727402 RepID=A0AAW2TMB0_9LAMI